MSRNQIKKIVASCSDEEIIEHIWYMQVTFMSLVEWIQSHYPTIKIPEELKRM